jgi:hypothetical protein
MVIRKALCVGFADLEYSSKIKKLQLTSTSDYLVRYHGQLSGAKSAHA